MVAGIPGTGIGGIFYLLSALLMPLHESLLFILGYNKKIRWSIVIKQAVIAIGTIVGIWITGWIIFYIFNLMTVEKIINVTVKQVPKSIQMVTVYLSLLNLVFVITIVQVLSIFSKCKNK